MNKDGLSSMGPLNQPNGPREISPMGLVKSAQWASVKSAQWALVHDGCISGREVAYLAPASYNQVTSLPCQRR